MFYKSIEQMKNIIPTTKGENGMKKDITRRIAYYTKKVAARGAVHPARKQRQAFKYRNERLLLYKKLLRELIENASEK